MKKRKGFIAVSILLTMLLALSIGAIGIGTSASLRKSYVSAVSVKENYLLGDNFMTYYQLYVSHQIKSLYKALPYDSKYKEQRNDLEKMNALLLKRCYSLINSTWATDFIFKLKQEDTKTFLGYELYDALIEKEYYNVKTKRYEYYSGEITNSDFRVIITMKLDDEKRKRFQLNTEVYFYVPSYTYEQLEQWLLEDEFTINEDAFEMNKLTRTGDIVVFG